MSSITNLIDKACLHLVKGTPANCLTFLLSEKSYGKNRNSPPHSNRPNRLQQKWHTQTPLQIKFTHDNSHTHMTQSSLAHNFMT
mmetsp:Transcript_23704/g.57170  ORF Transcript_23704/g.57170 Transcript_23704/m.57170 type:complete len:84 (-) Transcript_23704:40-291(-)